MAIALAEAEDDHGHISVRTGSYDGYAGKITSADALAYAASALKDEKLAIAVLEEHLLAGRFRMFARATMTDVDMHPMYTKLPVAGHSCISDKRVAREPGWHVIAAGHWRSEFHRSQYHDSMLNWKEGAFGFLFSRPIRYRNDPKTGEWLAYLPPRYTYFDVHFLKVEIEAAVGANLKAGASKRAARYHRPEPPKPRHRRSSLNWDGLLAGYRSEAERGELDVGRPVNSYGAQAALVKKMRQDLQRSASNVDIEVSLATLKRRAAELLKVNDFNRKRNDDEPS